MKSKKIFAILVAILIIFQGIAIKTYAATTGSFSVGAGTTQLDVNGTTSINISVKNCEGKFSIVSSDSSVVSVSKGSEWVSSSASITVTAKKAGTATITVNADNVADNQEQSQDVTGSKSVTITVKAPQQTQTQQTQTQQTQTQQTQTQQTQTQQPQTQQPQVTYTPTNKTLYVKNSVGANLRNEATVNGKIIATLAQGNSVTVTAEGSNGWSKVTCNSGTGYIRSDLLTSTKPAEEDEQKKKEEEEAKKKAEEEAEAKRKEEEEKQNASNKSLQKLEIDGYTLEPAFTPENTKYTLQLKENDDVEELKINAVPADEKADVTIEGNKDFSVGNKIVKITVTAQDKTTRLYTISVVKPGETAQVDDLKLAVLKVANANLDPTFDKDIKNYTIETDDPSKIKEEDIVVDPEDDKVKATIAIKDNDDGSKIITILLESEDEKDNRTGVYQINVIKPVVTQEVVTKGKVDKKIYIIFGSIIGVLLLLIIIVCIALKKTGDDDYYDDEEDDDEYYDENNDNDDYNQKDTNNSSKFDQSLKNAIDEANGLYNYDADQDLSPKSQILSKRIQNQDMDHTQLFDSEKFKEVSDNNSKRKGKHF